MDKLLTSNEAALFLDINTQEFEDFIQKHKTLETEYTKAIEIFVESKEWELEYLLSEKKYYETEYSHGTEKEEYKEICRQIENFNKKGLK